MAKSKIGRDKKRASSYLQGNTIRAINALAFVAGSVVPLQVAIAQAAQQAQSDQLEQIIVTGTRIIRDGYEAPTPLTVLTSESLQQNTATANVADTLIRMPAFANSQTPSSSVSGASAATQGLNVLNLRGMGGNRTLTLFDGQRAVPSLFSGEVDVNNFPQQLISRVEVVTGGGSAVYGSDAVAGVVNFILDKDFTGTKAEVSAGQTSYNDDSSYKAAISHGFAFAEGRGHVLLSGEIADREGVTPGDNGRGWNYSGWGIMVNPAYTPTNGQPEYLVRPEISLSNATHGGIIIAGPLRGIAFGQGGVPYQFNYGPITNDPWMQGGDWRSTEVRHDRSGSLEPENKRRNLFARISYDVTDNVNLYLQAAWGDNRSYTSMWPAFQAGNGPTILSGNPHIPQAVQEQMTTLGVTSFRIGSMNYDLPNMATDVNRVTSRVVLGLDGSFTAWGRPWTWNAYYQWGEAESNTKILGTLHSGRYALAVDAVRHPTTGAIVCRSTLTDPGNGCVPWNPLGLGVNNQAALDYVIGVTSVVQTLGQDVFAVSTQGEVGSTWAGPISVALSAEYREDTAEGVPSGGGPWFAGNFSAFEGSNSVTEGAIEAIIPFARGVALADNFEISTAARVTDYEYSGRVETWKVGAVWAPVPGMRFRSTRSRDIRAPNFNELLAASNSGQRSVFDPFTNTTPQFFGENTGNPNLQPEEGDTFEVGVVLQPTFLPGFSASIDYWDIKLSGAVARPNDVQIVTFCFQGRQEFCNNIERTDGVISKITQFPFNLASQRKTGIDVELSQTFSASSLVSSWPGQFAVNALATFYQKSEQDDGLGDGVYSTLGNMGQFTVGPPDWRMMVNLGYALDKFSGSLTVRGQDKGVLDARWIECTSGCPASGAFAKTVESNSVSSVYYVDASLKYGFDLASTEVEAFFNVRNLLNKDPSIVPQGPSDFTYVFPLSKSPSGFDLLGRQYMLGVRVRM